MATELVKVQVIRQVSWTYVFLEPPSLATQVISWTSRIGHRTGDIFNQSYVGESVILQLHPARPRTFLCT